MVYVAYAFAECEPETCELLFVQNPTVVSHPMGEGESIGCPHRDCRRASAKSLAACRPGDQEFSARNTITPNGGNVSSAECS